jgi:hypothetical protein
LINKALTIFEPAIHPSRTVTCGAAARINQNGVPAWFILAGSKKETKTPLHQENDTGGVTWF